MVSDYVNQNSKSFEGSISKMEFIGKYNISS